MSSNRELTMEEIGEIRKFLQARQEVAAVVTYIKKTKDVKKGTEIVDDRILVVTNICVYSFKPGAKSVARQGHFYELKELQSESPDDVKFVFKDFILAGRFEGAEAALGKVIWSLRMIYGGGSKLPVKITVAPEGRKLPVPDVKLGDCGGYAMTYRAVASILNIPPREDVCWDIESIWGPSEITEFNLGEFDVMVGKDLQALVQPLRYNPYFTAFSAKHMQMGKEGLGYLGDVFRYNSTITDLVLTDIGANKQDWVTFFDTLATNSSLALSTISITNAAIDDKAAISLANLIGNLKQGIKSLDLSGCQAEKKGCTAICNALKKNGKSTATLVDLNFSKNQLGADGSSALANFLSTPNCVKKLILSDCGVSVDPVAQAIIRGSSELTHVDVSHNKFIPRDVSGMEAVIKAAGNLIDVNLAFTRMSMPFIRTLCQAFAGNTILTNLTISFAGNDIGPKGGKQLVESLSKMHNVTTLDISECDLSDEGLIELCDGLVRMSHLKKLNLDNNLKPKVAKATRDRTMMYIIQLLDSERPIQLRSFSFRATSKVFALAKDVIPLLDALLNCESLEVFDVSGHGFSDAGCIALAKSLQINSSLLEVYLDDNNLTLHGIRSLRTALQRNHTLRHLSLPLTDLMTCCKDAKSMGVGKKMMDDIFSYLRRNAEPRKFVSQSGQDATEFMLELLNDSVDTEARRVKAGPAEIQAEDDVKVLLKDAASFRESLGMMDFQVKTLETAQCEAVKKIISDMADEMVKEVAALHQGAIKEWTVSLAEKFKSVESFVGLATVLAVLPGQINEATVHNSLKAANQLLTVATHDAAAETTAAIANYMAESLIDKLQAVASRKVEVAEVATPKVETSPAPSRAPKAPLPSAPKNKNLNAGKRAARPTSVMMGSPLPIMMGGMPPRRAGGGSATRTPESANDGVSGMTSGMAGMGMMGGGDPNAEKEVLSAPKKLEHTTKGRPAARRNRKPPTRKTQV